MSYHYGARKKKFKNKEGVFEEAYYAVSKSTRIVEIKELADLLAYRSSLTPGDIYSTLIGLSALTKEMLRDGYKVKLDGIGVFGVAITSKGFSTEKELDPKKVKFSKVSYRADKALVQELKTMKYVKELPPPKGYVSKRIKEDQNKEQ